MSMRARTREDDLDEAMARLYRRRAALRCQPAVRYGGNVQYDVELVLEELHRLRLVWPRVQALLDGLHRGVEWELAPAIKREIGECARQLTEGAAVVTLNGIKRQASGSTPQEEPR